MRIFLLSFLLLSFSSIASGPPEITSIRKNVIVENESFNYLVQVCLTVYNGWGEDNLCSKKVALTEENQKSINSLLLKSTQYIKSNSQKSTNRGKYIGVIIGTRDNYLTEGFTIQDLVNIFESPNYNLNLN